MDSQRARHRTRGEVSRLERAPPARTRDSHERRVGVGHPPGSITLHVVRHITELSGAGDPSPSVGNSAFSECRLVLTGDDSANAVGLSLLQPFCNIHSLRFAAHVDQAFSNLDIALEAADVTRSDVVKVTTFVVGYDHDAKWPVIRSAHSSFFGKTVPAWTVVGVEALAKPNLLIEIEATAAKD